MTSRIDVDRQFKLFQCLHRYMSWQNFINLLFNNIPLLVRKRPSSCDVFHFFSLLNDGFQNITIMLTFTKGRLEFVDKESNVLWINPTRSFGIILAPFINKRFKVFTSDRTQSFGCRYREAIKHKGRKQIKQNHLRYNNVAHKERVSELRATALNSVRLNFSISLRSIQALYSVIAAFKAHFTH